MIRFECHRLVTLVLVETQVPPAVRSAVLVFFPTKDKPTVFGALLIVEEHPCRVAVGSGVLLSHKVRSRKLRIISYHHPSCSIRLNDINAVDGDLVERRVL